MNKRLYALILAALLGACRDTSETPSAAPRDIPRNMTPAVEQAAPNPMAAAPAAAGAEQSPLAWKTPAGWTELPAAQFRNPNFKIDAIPEAEAYVTLLPGAGGGAAPNLNRWRGQFSLPDLTPVEMAALPTLTVMGQPATLLDQTGKYGGMSGGEVKENWRLVGAIIDLPAVLITVKMTGPAAALDGELQHFKDLVQSITMAPPGLGQAMTSALSSTATLPAGHPAIGGAAPAMAALPGAATPADVKFTWTLPPDWIQGPEKQMRLATFQVKGNTMTDCSLIMLAGTAGGKEANIVRWYGQVGQPAPSADVLAKLPTIKILGQDSPIVEATGSYSGMGTDSIANAELLGAICEMPDQTLFIKMTGPADVIKAQHDAFVAFCLSLKNK